MKPIICACGTEKVEAAGYVRCQHCDDHCPDRAGCILCGQYTLATRKRTDAEYKLEKSAG